MKHTLNKSQRESGNVLFLILIAVALFAALSYVVTQSTRSGGGSTEREKNILSSAQMTQYPTALRTSIIRMVLGGVGIENIVFNSPTDFSTISTNLLVFHPEGGGATFQEAPADLGTPGSGPLTWYFNPTYRIPGVGLDTNGTGNDLIAFLPGISAGICRQANEELGVLTQDCAADTGNLTSGVPTVASTTNSTIRASMTRTVATPYTFPGTGVAIAGAGDCATTFDRKASGCFYDDDGDEYVFYSVLLER